MCAQPMPASETELSTTNSPNSTSPSTDPATDPATSPSTSAPSASASSTAPSSNTATTTATSNVTVSGTSISASLSNNSVRKLLNPHSSVLNVLSHPDLDLELNHASQTHHQHPQPVPHHSIATRLNNSMTGSNHHQHILNRERFPSPAIDHPISPQLQSSPHFLNHSHLHIPPPPPPPHSYPPPPSPFQPHDLSNSLASWQSINMSTESMRDWSDPTCDPTGKTQSSSHRHLSPINPPSPSFPSHHSPHPQDMNECQRTTSILSITSDEDEYSLVRIPSIQKAMVLDTDEEDGDDVVNVSNDTADSYAAGDVDVGDETKSSMNLDLVQQSHQSTTTSSFIMPKMSISDKLSSFQMTILTSVGFIYQAETGDLSHDVQHNWNLSSNSIKVSHLILDHNITNQDKQTIKQSDLLFIVNDGSNVLSNCLASIFGDANDDDMNLPKVTIINMMTVNYFSNLFDLISALKPYQVWRAPSLKQPKLLDKLKEFINNELSDDTICRSGGGGKYNQEYCKKLAHYTQRDQMKQSQKQSKTSVSYELTCSHVPSSFNSADYKVIEKQFKSDLKCSTIYDNVDPLRLSSRLYHVNILYSILKKLFASFPSNQFILTEHSISSSQPPTTSSTSSLSVNSSGFLGNSSLFPSWTPKNNLWLFCSFTLGIGLGVGITSGAFTVIGIYIYDTLSNCFSQNSSLIADDLVTTTSTSSSTSASLISILNDGIAPLYDMLSSVKTAVVPQVLDSVGGAISVAAAGAGRICNHVINQIDAFTTGDLHAMVPQMSPVIDAMPYVRDVSTTCVDYLKDANDVLMGTAMGGFYHLNQFLSSNLQLILA